MSGSSNKDTVCIFIKCVLLIVHMTPMKKHEIPFKWFNMKYCTVSESCDAGDL